MYWANIPYSGGIISRYLSCNDHCPLPHAGSFICLNWLGGGTEREVRGEGLLGGRGQGGKGKGKGAIVSETCGHLGGQGENGESPAVQSGHALPKGRCASPPCC